MMVVDASVIVKLLVAEPGTDLARAAVTADDHCIAPDLLMIEVAGALAKKMRFEGLPHSAAVAGLRNVPAFVERLVKSASLLGTATDLSIELSHSLFDCLYLALAIERDCTVLTADRKFVACADASGYGSNVSMLR